MKFSAAVSIFLTSTGLAFASNEPSTLQDSCSNVAFTYLGAEAGIQATCLRSDGMPVETSIALSGISNRDGVLTYSGGDSSFQRTCGSIRVLSQGGGLILHARCRNLAGNAQPTSIEIMGISNQNGELSN